MDKFNAIKKYLSGIDNVADIIPLHNAYCKRNSYPDLMISPQGSINTNISSIIDYDRLADFLIDWGDSGFNFDITGYLVEEFKTYAYELVYERYSMEEISAKVDECTDDFLMDDWDDILADMFDIVCSCPECCAIIYRDNNKEYIYETGRMLYGCPECGEEVLD